MQQTQFFNYEPEPLSENQCRNVAAEEVKAAQNYPTSLVQDLRRQAVVSLQRTGDARAAIVMAAATCETFIDLLLSALLWEEGLTPEEAAVELNRYRDINARLLSMLASRLRGNWNPNEVLPLGDWQTLIAGSRNRVVHTGRLPSQALALEACEAISPFFSMLLDRLCAHKTRATYPMVCVLIAGRTSLEARSGWTRKISSAADEADRLDLNGVFARWYFQTTNLAMPAEWRTAPGSGETTLVITSSDLRYWVEYDTKSEMARKLAVDLDTDQFIDQLSLKGPGSFTFDEIIPSSPTGEWIPSYRLVPGLAVMRDPKEWQEPSG